jgi:hypothetical protein
VGRKKKNEDQIELYRHPLGPECGRVELVDYDGDGDARMICISERGVDTGVVFDITIDPEVYAEMCDDEEVATLEGSIVEADSGNIEVVEVPDDPPVRPDRTKKGNVRVLKTAAMWSHPWGRCCCVHHGGELEPVTPERIAADDVPWWGESLTPYQLDLTAAANDPYDAPMHVLTDFVCGICEHSPWVVFPEDVPDEEPVPPEEVEGEEPLCPERSALDDAEWENKKDAWDVFRLDPHNKRLIDKSGLPVARATERQRFSTEKAFEQINSQPVTSNIYTVKQAFYFAMGKGRSGTWGDFDLDVMRLVRGLEDVDIPASILEEVDLEDAESTEEMRGRAAVRETEASVDEDAEYLEHMMDDGDEEFEEIDMDDELEDRLDDEDETRKHWNEADDGPEVLEPGSRRTRKRRKSPTVKQAKRQVVNAAMALQKALGVFIKAIEDEDGGNGHKHAQH